MRILLSIFLVVATTLSAFGAARVKDIASLQDSRENLLVGYGLVDTEKQLLEFYDLAGLQRHLKVLGIFCRLNYRDGKPQYLGDLPLVAKYVLEVLELYPQLSDFKRCFAPLIEQSRR